MAQGLVEGAESSPDVEPMSLYVYYSTGLTAQGKEGSWGPDAPGATIWFSVTPRGGVGSFP